MKSKQQKTSVGIGRLLGLVRSERARQNAPAVLARRAKPDADDVPNPGLARSFRNFRSHCGEVSRIAFLLSGLRYLPAGKIVLSGGGHKYCEVAQELKIAGLDSREIVFLAQHLKRWSITRIVVWIPIVVQVIVCRIFLIRRLSQTMKLYQDVLCRYLCMISVLRSRPPADWIVIGDLSTQSIATFAAVGATGSRLLSWQFDFLDFKPFPTPANIAVVLNETGIELSRIREGNNGCEKIYWRPVFDINPLRQDVDEFPVGVLLNAFADVRVLRRLERLQQRIERPFLIRLHPNSRLGEEQLAKGCRIADCRQSLVEFVRKVGFVICGNTSAQLKALCLGTPVVQLADMDDLQFDHHGYVRRGIVIGFLDDKQLNLDLAKLFYSSGNYVSCLRQLLGPKKAARAQGLEKLVSLIANTD